VAHIRQSRPDSDLDCLICACLRCSLFAGKRTWMWPRAVAKSSGVRPLRVLQRQGVIEAEGTYKTVKAYMCHIRQSRFWSYMCHIRQSRAGTLKRHGVTEAVGGGDRIHPENARNSG